MKENCYDKGTIQAFFDGELSADNLENVARHTAFCERCAFLLKETEEETAAVFAAMETELNPLVPTERIRTNLYRAISEIERDEKSGKKVLSRFSALFSKPLAPALASLTIIFGLFGIYFFGGNPESSETAATKTYTPQREETRNREIGQSNEILPPSETAPPVKTEPNLRAGYSPKKSVVKYIEPKTEAKIIKAGFQRSHVKTNFIKKSDSAEVKENTVQPANAGSVEGEDVYLKTIASLNKTVEKNKDEVLRPSARFAFEKDLAIVDDAIAKMKIEVSKNPKNEAAKEMLKSSYQSKINLLNSVAERQMLTAALR